MRSCAWSFALMLTHSAPPHRPPGSLSVPSPGSLCRCRPGSWPLVEACLLPLSTCDVLWHSEQASSLRTADNRCILDTPGPLVSLQVMGARLGWQGQPGVEAETRETERRPR